MLIVGAELPGGRRASVRTHGDVITEIGPALEPRVDERVHDARGGALLPGLHDHHIHLQATARAGTSIACGPPDACDETGLAQALRAASRDGAPIRGVGYHESVAGDLDAARLDAWVSELPLRIQHRTGALWMLNSAALAGIEPGPDGWPEGAERDASGQPTGRFFRLDRWLREHLGAADRPCVDALSRKLAAAGVTGVTDTTATLVDDDVAYFRAEIARGALLQRCLLMGESTLSDIAHPQLARGAVKILLDEPALPDLDALIARIRDAHSDDRGVALHCATRVELAFACTALREAGPHARDRIEHASVAPPEWVDVLAGGPVAVVTQPHFVRERGDAYLEDVDAVDRPWLYRARAWLEAGVPLAAGSDAPYGTPDPWRAMAAAVERRTASGHRIGEQEALGPEEALALFTSDPAEPGVTQRKIKPGTAADLVLLDVPWSIARGDLDAKHVALTLCGGDPAFDARAPFHAS